MIGSGTQKFQWAELPSDVRDEVERFLGAPVVSALTQPGGFSPGVAVIVETSTGIKAFVKSSSATASVNLREIEHTTALQGNPRIPKLLHSFEKASWVTLIYELVNGKHPGLPWKSSELEFVMSELAMLSLSLTPCPQLGSFQQISESSKDEFNGWRNFAKSGNIGELEDEWIDRHLDALVEFEVTWPEVARGDSLVHTDLRADQILITSDKAIFLDWPHACIGAPWLDYLFMFPSVELQGGPEMAMLIENSPLTRVPKGHLIAMSVALAGFFMWNSVQPPPPRLVTIRKFQRDQGDTVMRWLKKQGI